MAVTNGWGQATQNNTNGFGKYQNTIDAGSVYADSYAGETSLVGTSAAFSYSASSYHQGESDPTPTITGTAGGVFVGTTGTIFVDSGTNTASSTGQIDLSASTIDSHIITYTVGGVQANQTVGITASPFIANNFSMNFDAASSQYIDAGDSDAFSFGNGSTDVPFSISCWVKFTSSGTFGIVSKYGTTNSLREWLLYRTSSKIRLLLHNGSTNNFATGSTSLSQNIWYHITATYDGRGGSTAYNGINIYINGQAETLTYSGGSYTAMQNTSQPVEIGRYQATRYIDGKLDEVAIWNTALSPDAVTEIYNATANNTGKVLDLTQDSGNYNASSNLQYFNRMGD